MNSSNFVNIWNDYIAQIETALIVYLNNANIHKTLKDSMTYSVMAGGKRLRPTLMLATAKMLCGEGDLSVMPLACAVEYIHTYSLIHDDLPAMDDDELRRGKPTNHMVYGEAMAILAGDGLLNLAFETMLDNVPENKANGYLKSCAFIAKCAGSQGMIAGQAADISLESTIANEENLLYIHHRKTGALINASVLGGAYAVQAGEDICAKLKQYSDNLGLAFQAVDDILDVTGNAQTLGKSIGKDSKSEKITFISVYGQQKAQKLAMQYTQNAMDSVGGISGAQFLQDMAEFMQNRKK